MKKIFLGFMATMLVCMALCVGASAANGTKLETSHGGQTLSGGEYYLDGDVTISQTITVSGTVTLDLNGHVLKYENAQTHGSPLAVKSGGHLTIKDSKPTTKHTFATNSDGLWVLDETNGTETVSGGIITGGTGTSVQFSTRTQDQGGGVYVAEGGALTMSAMRKPPKALPKAATVGASILITWGRSPWRKKRPSPVAWRKTAVRCTSSDPTVIIGPEMGYLTPMAAPSAATWYWEMAKTIPAPLQAPVRPNSTAV